MSNKLKNIINEEIKRSIDRKKRYEKARALVESYVRESLLNKIISEKRDKSSQVRKMLNDPAINKSGLARKINGLSDNDDTRRSEISKIARGEWNPNTDIQNDILHKIATSTE